MGNTFYSKKEFELALENYNKTLEILNDLSGIRERSLKVTTFLNLSAVYLKLNKFNKVLENASSVLLIEEDNIKALYR